MYRRYYSPFEEQPITKEYEPEIIKPQKIEEKPEGECSKKHSRKDFFGGISTEDIILIGILLLILLDDNEQKDIPLVLGIAFLFLIGYIDRE